MICQDCTKKDAINLIHDLNKNMSFLVCEDCIKEEDILFDYSIEQIVKLEGE